ncbi:CHAP domain-containing protein [Staphylococcus pseudintermedius]|nr:CHAP domain-containing protein [Staphylococcus pseudintermedius]
MNTFLALMTSQKFRKIVFALIALIVIPIISLLVLLASFQQQQRQNQDSGYEVNGTCSVKGGDLTGKGRKLFDDNSKGGALEGKIKDIEKIAKNHNIPPTLFVAIIASESQWGKGANATKQKNPLSVMGAGTIHDSEFSTIEKGLEAGAKNLQEEYINKGLTSPEKIGPKYAPTIGATNDPSGMNNNWIPTVKGIMKDLGGSKVTGCSGAGKGKDIKFKGKIPKWSNSDAGKGNLYTAGQCTWYAYGIRQKMGKPISTFWFHAQFWNDRAKADGYKVNDKPAVGALMIAEPGAAEAPPITGHVAVVIDVKDKNTFVVTEMNIKGEYQISQRELTVQDGLSFIHDKE